MNILKLFQNSLKKNCMTSNIFKECMIATDNIFPCLNNKYFFKEDLFKSNTLISKRLLSNYNENINFFNLIHLKLSDVIETINNLVIINLKGVNIQSKSEKSEFFKSIKNLISELTTKENRLRIALEKYYCQKNLLEKLSNNLEKAKLNNSKYEQIVKIEMEIKIASKTINEMQSNLSLAADDYKENRIDFTEKSLKIYLNFMKNITREYEVLRALLLSFFEFFIEIVNNFNFILHKNNHDISNTNFSDYIEKNAYDHNNNRKQEKPGILEFQANTQAYCKTTESCAFGSDIQKELDFASKAFMDFFNNCFEDPNKNQKHYFLSNNMNGLHAEKNSIEYSSNNINNNGFRNNNNNYINNIYTTTSDYNDEKLCDLGGTHSVKKPEIKLQTYNSPFSSNQTNKKNNFISETRDNSNNNNRIFPSPNINAVIEKNIYILNSPLKLNSKITSQNNNISTNYHSKILESKFNSYNKLNSLHDENIIATKEPHVQAEGQMNKLSPSSKINSELLENPNSETIQLEQLWNINNQSFITFESEKIQQQANYCLGKFRELFDTKLSLIKNNFGILNNYITISGFICTCFADSIAQNKKLKRSTNSSCFFNSISIAEDQNLELESPESLNLNFIFIRIFSISNKISEEIFKYTINFQENITNNIRVSQNYEKKYNENIKIIKEKLSAFMSSMEALFKSFLSELALLKREKINNRNLFDLKMKKILEHFLSKQSELLNEVQLSFNFYEEIFKRIGDNIKLYEIEFDYLKKNYYVCLKDNCEIFIKLLEKSAKELGKSYNTEDEIQNIPKLKEKINNEIIEFMFCNKEYKIDFLHESNCPSFSNTKDYTQKNAVNNSSNVNNITYSHAIDPNSATNYNNIATINKPESLESAYHHEIPNPLLSSNLKSEKISNSYFNKIKNFLLKIKPNKSSLANSNKSTISNLKSQYASMPNIADTSNNKLNSRTVDIMRCIENIISEIQIKEKSYENYSINNQAYLKKEEANWFNRILETFYHRWKENSFFKKWFSRFLYRIYNKKRPQNLDTIYIDDVKVKFFIFIYFLNIISSQAHHQL